MILIEHIVTPLTGEALYRGFASKGLSFFLDSSMNPKGLGRFSFLGADPYLIFQAKGDQVEINRQGLKTRLTANPLEVLQRLLAEQAIPSPHEVPFIGGAVGYFAYDSCPWAEPIAQKVSDDLNLPDIYLGFYDGIITIDHDNETVLAVACGIKQRPEVTLQQLKQTLALAEADPSLSIDAKLGPQKPPDFTANLTHTAYLSSIQRIKDYIAAGDVYQVNFAQRFQCRQTQPPEAVFAALRKNYPAPFGAYLDFGSFQIISNSPERFFSIRNGIIETRPIKGTRPRGKTPERDRRLQQALLHSAKDRAELLMIIDLARNDIGKVAEPGSIHVPECFALETYPTVSHLVAAVQGRLRSGVDTIDCLKALFPGGSITGAPKIRAIEIIDELEPVSRGVYTGALGWLGLNGDADLNIAIRTLTHSQGQYTFHAGSGIVWDSVGELEYQETLDKARALMASLGSH